MSATLDDQDVTSGNSFTWPDDANLSERIGLSQYSHHMIQVSGAGGGVITADQGSGYQAVETLTAESATYRLPNSKGIKIDASGGDINFSIYSYNEGADK